MFEGFAIVVAIPIAMLVGYCFGVDEGRRKEAADRELGKMIDAAQREAREAVWQ